MLKRNLIYIGCLILGLVLASSSPATTSSIPVLKLDDVIVNPIVNEFIAEGVREAEMQGAPCVIIELDTPGGLLSSTRAIVKTIMNAKVPVVVYIAPSGAHAGSAGVFITYAAHVAVMAPSTNIGAAHPVQVGDQKSSQGSDLKDLFKKKEEIPDKDAGDGVMSDKIMNDTLAWIRGIAKTRGRNVQWAEQAVRKSVSITAQEAMKLKVIDFIAADRQELLEKLEGRTVKVGEKNITLHVAGSTLVVRTMSWRQNFLNTLINPNIAYLLMSLGFIGLMFELTHPGTWVPGIVGLVSLILAYYAFQTLPTNFTGFALIGLAILLFIAEALVTSFGFLALGGVMCMLLGSIILVDSPFELMTISWTVIIPVVLFMAMVFVFLSTLAIRAQRSKKEVGISSMIGVEGMADTDIAAAGKVFAMGEIWDATAEELITKGEKVKVIEVNGLKLKVEQINVKEVL
jgi:membrane-bound serine protease (ClpP class)